ncbi:MAG TPA: dihydroorotate dehydrogenase electron transfer subunit [Gemmataceae bacterium]|jgi:dihydroorotate dehydrogenase electron transfer subunit|nr:dihydroorotate dehydrogenase electron transfer subunit [Gemmataceae bacterium]
MNRFAKFQGVVPVLENDRLARSTFRIRLKAPDMARSIVPGQFIMIRIPQTTDPLLGRPFALYDTVIDTQGQPNCLDVVYLVVGKMTAALAAVKAGAIVEVWGPLGNGFPYLQDLDHVALVAGGIGQTPFLAYVHSLLGRRGYGGGIPRRACRRVSLFYGVRTAALAAGVEDFQSAGADVHLASDDGTLGFKGFVTQLLALQPRPDHLVGCGPEPMLQALLALARAWEVPCHLSLETPMACGVGICFSCVTRVRTRDGVDYRRICVEGPVFNGADLAWK